MAIYPTTVYPAALYLHCIPYYVPVYHTTINIYIYIYPTVFSRARAAARGQSTEKETLMTNMDEQTVYAVSFNNDLYDPDQVL